MNSDAAGDFADIKTLLDELAGGRMVVLVDDEARENEGDLVAAARFITPETVNFMAQAARGLICLTLTETHCQKLQLPMMTATNNSTYATNFTVSVEAAQGVTTGISAHDRAATILAASNPAAKPADIVSPGHIFPVRAAEGGVLVRAGHTEAGCDLTAMAGLFPAAVICEIMNEDGSMARLKDLRTFAKKHNLPIGTIKSLIAHRLKNEKLVRRERDEPARTVWGDFRMAAYRDTIDDLSHLAIYRGDIRPDKPVLVRVALRPTPLDAILQEFSPPSWGVGAALQRIAQEPCGIVLLLAAGGGDEEKIRRQSGLLPPLPPPAAGNLRHYGLGAQILRDLGAGKIRLLSGPLRLPNMEGFGLSVEEIIAP